MSEQWKHSETGEDDVQMPLGVGGGEGGGDTPYNEPKAAMNTSTLALIASFLAALAVLYLLGLHNKPRSASAAETARHDMQTAITAMLQKDGKPDQVKNVFKDTDKLVQLFYHYLGSQASRSSELPGNPFAPDVAYTPAPTAHSDDAASLIANSAVDAENLRRVAEAFNSLKLQSVMLGRTSVAMINNQLVEVGGTIGEFTVKSIEAGRVLLSYGKNTFELKLAGQSTGKR